MEMNYWKRIVSKYVVVYTWCGGRGRALSEKANLTWRGRKFWG